MKNFTTTAGHKMKHPRTFPDIARCSRTGATIKKDALYYAVNHGEAYGRYLANVRAKREAELLKFCRTVLKDKNATLEAL